MLEVAAAELAGFAVVAVPVGLAAAVARLRCGAGAAGVVWEAGAAIELAGLVVSAEAAGEDLAVGDLGAVSALGEATATNTPGLINSGFFCASSSGLTRSAPASFVSLS